MKKIYGITVICTFVMTLFVHGSVAVGRFFSNERERIKVGFVYVGDSCDAYTSNFMRAQHAIEAEFEDRVEIVAKYNVAEGTEEVYLRELVDCGCNLIFTTSYGYGETAKKLALENPDVEFCAATCANANEEPILKNYHNFMGEIYQGRYIAGVVAGMKLAEMIESGNVDSEHVKIGYVGAFPYAEVISGYTAFYLGIHSIVPEAEMKVIYTESWGDYSLEKAAAQKLIDEGCVILSQHSDTTGPAVACEEARGNHTVCHVGYNQSMSDVAPTTSLISCRINWQEYMVAATGAVLHGKKIESAVKGNKHGNDVSGGFKENWIQMLKLNETIAAEGTKEKIEELRDLFCRGKVAVFFGDYTGTDPYNQEDRIHLKQEYKENRESSAPTFHYILDDVIATEFLR